MLFREVDLGSGIPGGCTFTACRADGSLSRTHGAEAARLGVTVLVCLVPMDEIREKSSSYAKALEQGMVPVEVRRFPIHDYSSPDDDRAFADTVTEVAASLRAGRRALIHYGAGIGRTGLFAVATLMALGLPTVAARRRVKEAGSGPERQVQEAALERVAQFLCLDQA